MVGTFPLTLKTDFLWQKYFLPSPSAAMNPKALLATHLSTVPRKEEALTGAADHALELVDDYVHRQNDNNNN